MKPCIICNRPINDQIFHKRKIMACSETCRQHYYRDKKSRTEVRNGHYENRTVKALRHLGFKVTISDSLVGKI